MARMDITIYTSAPDHRFSDAEGRRPHQAVKTARRIGDCKSARHAAIASRGMEALRREAIDDARYAQ